MKRFLLSAAAGALALAAGCNGGRQGRVTVLLTDAPATFEAAVVTITRITLHGENGDTVLSDQKTTTDLLTLANDVATLAKDAVVAPGTYQELRFQISGAYIEVPAATGTGTEIFASSPTYEGLPPGAVVSGPLKMPSYAQSGLKVDFAAGSLDVQAESKVLLVDFDVAQSFGHDTGNQTGWVMHPVIKGAELTISGNVDVTIALGTGVTLPVVNNAQVTLGQFDAVLTSGDGTEKTLPFTDRGGGVFGATFKYLFPGVYSVDVQAPAGVTFTTDPAHPASVTVEQGMDAHVGFTVTSASSP